MFFKHSATTVAFITILTMASGVARAGRGRGPMRRRPQCRVALGKMTRGQVRVESWGEHIIRSHPSPRLHADPWQATLSGYRRGTVVKLETQHPSAAIELPGGCKAKLPANTKIATKIDPKVDTKLSSKRRRRRNSTAWRRAVAEALRYNPLRQFDVTTDSPKQKQLTDQIAEELAVHTPVRALATTADGRRYAAVYTNVAGKVTSNRREGSHTVQMSGLFEPHYAAWAETKNIFVTPVKNDTVRVLGLAAFPRGAKITVTNENQGKGTSFIAGSYAGRKERSGGDFAVVAAKPGERLKIQVRFDGVQNASNPSIATYFVEVPPSGRGKADIEARGRRYFRATVQPEHPQLDATKLSLSPAVQCRGGSCKGSGAWGAGHATLTALDGAFSRGATVTVTNLRLKAEGSKDAVVSTVVGQSGTGADKIQVPAVFNDRLEVHVAYPGSNQPQQVILDVPAHGARQQ